MSARPTPRPISGVMSAPDLTVPGLSALALRALRGEPAEPTPAEWSALLAGNRPHPDDPWTGLEGLIELTQALGPRLNGQGLADLIHAALQLPMPEGLSPMLRRLRGGLRGLLTLGLRALEQPRPEAGDWVPLRLNDLRATDTELAALRLALRAPQATWFTPHPDTLLGLSGSVGTSLSGIPPEAWSLWHAAFRPHLSQLILTPGLGGFNVASRFAGRPIHLPVTAMPRSCSRSERIGTILTLTTELQRHWRPVPVRPGHHPLDAAVRQLGRAPVLSRRSRHRLSANLLPPDFSLTRSGLRSLNLLVSWLRQPLPELEEDELLQWQQITRSLLADAMTVIPDLTTHGAWRTGPGRAWAKQITQASMGGARPIRAGQP